jgi:prephenate dehydrogenase
MKDRSKKIAIIGGAGKMGRWLAVYLMKEGHEVVIADHDRDKLEEARRQLSVTVAPGNMEAVAGADGVIISVPIEGFEDVAREIGPHIRKGQVVIDITSTKAAPVKVMHRHIAQGLVLGAHPLFGPGATGIAPRNFVLTPTTDEERALAQKIKSHLEARDANVALMTPREHDDMMSLVLGLSHFIAIVSADTLLSAGRLHPMETSGSSTYKVLLTLIESVLSEDPELYASIQTSLPRVAEFERMFQSRAGEWVELVEKGDRQGFARRMQGLKEKLGKEAPGFVKAYENMYRIVEGL